MNSLPLDYLRSMVAGVPALDETLVQCLKEWDPELPPVTIVFAEIGHAIANSLALLPNDVRQKIFAAIEEGVVSHDPALGTAMTTGLVEALVTAADKKADLWTNFETLLGPVSMKHAIAWRDFGR